MNLGKELTLATGCVVVLGIWLSQPPYLRWNGRKPPVLTTENLQDTKAIDSPAVHYLHPSYTSKAYLITHLARQISGPGTKIGLPKCCNICFFSPFLVVFHQPMREQNGAVTCQIGSSRQLGKINEKGCWNHHLLGGSSQLVLRNLHFQAIKFGHLEGVYNNPILRGLTITMVINHWT